MSVHERERLSAYLDRELGAEDRARVEAHLATCPECRGFLEEIERVDSAVRAAQRMMEAPAGYFERLPGRVRDRIAADAGGRSRVASWAWAVAAALVLAVLTPLTLDRWTGPPAPAVLSPPAAGVPSPATGAGAAHEPAGPRAGSSPGSSAASAEGRPAAPRANAPAPQGPSSLADAAAGAERRRAGPAPPGAGDDARSGPAETAEAFAPPPARSADTAAEPAPAPPATADDDERLAVAGRSAAEPGAAKAFDDDALSESRSRGERAEMEEGPMASDPGFRRLAAARPRSAPEWREQRAEWLLFARSHPSDPRADEARVRAIEAARQALARSGSAEDEALFLTDARAYLLRPDALQKERVRRLLAASRPEP